MSTLLAEPTSRLATTPTRRLRTTMAAVRVSLQWLGVKKTLTPEQRSQAADTFGATRDFFSAGKKLLDTRHPSFKAVTAVRTKAVGFWKSLTLPFPEGGIRLIRQDRVEAFDAQMRQFQVELAEAVATLDRHYAELKSAAQDRLGTLFNDADYPASLDRMFEISWNFPSVEAPEYLQQLNPELYEQECQRMQQRFEEAVRLAEEAFTGELGKLVSHLTERLSGQVDGKPKIFRDSAIGNLSEFFDRFRQLNVRSNEQLDTLVDDAQRITRGIEPQQLRENAGLRQHVATELSRVQSVLDGLLVDRPRRNILRRPK